MSPERSSSGARGVAFEVLLRVENTGAFASILLDHRQASMPDPREAALAREIVLGTLRQRACIDHVLATASSRPIEDLDPAVRTALRAGAYQILFLDRVPDFAAVAATVEVVKKTGRRGAVGYVNAVLRSVARHGRSRLPPRAAAGDVGALALEHSHPRWWVARLVQHRGFEETAALLRADNRAVGPVLSVDRRRTDPERLAAELRDEGVVVDETVYAPAALRVRAGAAQSTAAFREARCWFQDEASQLVPEMFTRAPGRIRIADVCAAPGNKTMQLASRFAEAQLVACDRHPGRLRSLERSLARRGFASVMLLTADLTSPFPPLAAGRFERVLVDAPCTGTGTLRRHPEIRWRLRPGDPARLSATQTRILECAAALVAPGGELVYSVCSLEPEEGEEVVARFLRNHPSFRIADPADNLPEGARALIDGSGYLRTSPAIGGLDGFFAALLARL